MPKPKSNRPSNGLLETDYDMSLESNSVAKRFKTCKCSNIYSINLYVGDIFL